MKFALRVSAAAALLAVTGTAFAGLSVSSVIGNGNVLLSDNSAEQHIDANGNGILDEGDRLRGILDIGTIEQGGLQQQIGSTSGYNELTGIFEAEVLTKVATGDPGEFDYTFGAYSGFATEFGVPVGTVGIFFEDSAVDYAREGCGTFAGCEATASGGSIWAAFSVVLWSADDAQGTPSVGGNLPLTTPLGDFGVGLDFTVNNTGKLWDKVPCADVVNLTVSFVDFCGQGGILATGRNLGQTNTPYDIFNDVNFTAKARVPEPGSVALVGLALAALGAATRRRKA